MASKTKVLMLEDLSFSYALVTILFYQLPDIPSYLLGYNHLIENVFLQMIIPWTVFAALLTSILTYIDPVGLFIYVIMLIIDRRKNERPLPSFLIRSSLESSYLDYTRVRLKGAIYMAVLLIMIVILCQSLLFRALLITAIFFIFLRLVLKDIWEAAIGVYVVAAYNSTIREYTLTKSNVALGALNNAQIALNGGNWVEAFRWLGATGGITINVPKDILERAFFLKEGT